MLLLDTSFLIELEQDLLDRRPGPASAVLRVHAHRPAAISIVSLGEFAEGFSDPRDVLAFLAPFRVVQLSRAIALRMAALQNSLSRRLGENDAWIAATALSYGATIVGRERAFERIPRLDYIKI